MSLEYQCKNCQVRLDPLMTKEESDYFLKAGCPFCHQNCWQIVEGIYDRWVKDSNTVVLIEQEAKEDEEKGQS